MKFISVLVLLVAVSACSTTRQQKAVMEQADKPVNCATAKGDLRALQSEKAHVGTQIAAGVRAIIPVSALVNVVMGEEGTDFKVATGEYDKIIDKRIAKIKSTCGL